MNTSIRSLVLAFTLVAALLAGSLSAAHAQTVIHSVPYTISTPGHYVLGGNLNSSSTATTPAITVNAPNVVLDLGGFYVAGPYNPAATNTNQNSTILVGDVANVTIRNGLVAGNANGITFSSTTAANSRNYVVDAVTITHCYLMGIGFTTGTLGSRISNCTFTLLGNSTVGGSTYPSAIFSDGGLRIENNIISGVTPTGSGYSTGISGFYGDFSIGNTITGCYYGIIYGKYLNNLTYNCTKPFEYGADVGGNN